MTRRYPVTRLTDAETVGEHFLYRIFDGDDVLLYIGCTGDVEGRIYMHEQLSTGSPVGPWLRRGDAYWTSEQYPTKAAARSAERAAIADEAPAFNKQHQRKPLVVVESLREYAAGLSRYPDADTAS